MRLQGLAGLLYGGNRGRIVLRDGWSLNHGTVQKPGLGVGERIIRTARIMMGQRSLGDVQIEIRRRVLRQGTV